MAQHPLYSHYLALLRETGPELARVDPIAASALAAPGFDPDVERLLEGIAFIASKIDEKRLKGLDEACQLMMDILFPNYLMGVPASTIVALESRPDHPPRVLPRGTELLSPPVIGTTCRFRGAYEVDVDGLQLERVDWERRGPTAQLDITFRGALWLRERPPRDRIRLHLHGEPLLTRSLFRALLAQRERVELVDGRGQTLSGETVTLRALGYAEDEALLANPLGAFEGFRLLQEYFTLPEKFLFVDIAGVWSALEAADRSNRTSGLDLAGARAGGTDRFTLRFALRIDVDIAPTTEHLRLACVPAVNLFEHTADPIYDDRTRVEHRIRPVGPHLHHGIHRVLEVSARSRHGSVSYPLLSELDEPAAAQRFAQIRRARHSGDPELYLSVYEPEERLEPQTIQIDLLCSNGKLPTALGLGDVDTVHDEEHPARRCRNLMPVTRPALPELGEELRRRLVLKMALAQRDLTELEALKQAIWLYHPRAADDPQGARQAGAAVQALIASRSEEVQTLYRGVPIWGRATQVDFDPSAFAVPAESYLFGSVLNEYVALQAPINCFSRFVMRQSLTQEVFRWPDRIGTSELPR